MTGFIGDEFDYGNNILQPVIILQRLWTQLTLKTS